MENHKWNPFEEIDTGISGYMGNSPFNKYYGSDRLPRIDVYNTLNDIIIKAEIPGASKEDLHVDVDRKSVRIWGRVKRSNEEKDEHIHHSERFFGEFSRTVPLPFEIKPEGALAEYNDGVLTINVPKVEPSEPVRRKIEIQ